MRIWIVDNAAPGADGRAVIGVEWCRCRYGGAAMQRFELDPGKWTILMEWINMVDGGQIK